MHISARVTVMLTAVASTAVVAAAAPPAGSATASSSWRVALKVSGRNGPEFMAVTATSARNAWAFGGNDSNIPLAYHLSGSAWRKASFPRAVGDVIAASASSASNVWAFGSRDAARYNGARWSVMKKLGYIDSGLAVSAASVWVFGGATSTASVASWHYNGKSWTRIASGSGLEGASAAGAARRPDTSIRWRSVIPSTHSYTIAACLSSNAITESRCWWRSARSTPMSWRT